MIRIIPKNDNVRTRIVYLDNRGGGGGGGAHNLSRNKMFTSNVTCDRITSLGRTLVQRINGIWSVSNMQIRNSKLCESSKCIVYSAVNHPLWMSMLFHRRGLLWLGSAVRHSM